MADDITSPDDKTGLFVKKGLIRKGSYPDASITTPKLADGLITTAKIADSAITTAKLANDAVTSAKLALDQRQVFWVHPIYNAAPSGGYWTGTATFAQRSIIMANWSCSGYTSSAYLATAYFGIVGIGWLGASQFFFNNAGMHLTFPTSHYGMSINAGTYTFHIWASNFNTDSNDRGHLSMIAYSY